MKQWKSGKQRRQEIFAARALRRERLKARQVAENRRWATVLLPLALDGAAILPVDSAQLKSYSSYGDPEFVMRGYYQDLPFQCVGCGVQCLWTAERQKWWYEVAKGDVFSTARRCAECRAKERERKAQARKAWRAGLLRKRERLQATGHLPR